MNNCVYLHIPKTGGTTFVENFFFEGEAFSAQYSPEVINSRSGRLIHMHLPAWSLEFYCRKHGLSFEKVLDETTFVATLREPCDWLSSYWNFIVQKRLNFPHLLLPESQSCQAMDGFVNPLRFDPINCRINGISVDDYVSRFDGMHKSSFMQIAKHILSPGVRYDSIRAFMRYHLDPDSIPILRNGLFDISPYQGYSALDHVLRTYLFDNPYGISFNIYERLNLLVIPTDMLDIFLESSKKSSSENVFRELGVEALHSNARRDDSVILRQNVQHGKVLLSNKSRKIIENNMSSDVWALKTMRAALAQFFQ